MGKPLTSVLPLLVYRAPRTGVRPDRRPLDLLAAAQVFDKKMGNVKSNTQGVGGTDRFTLLAFLLGAGALF